MYKGKCQTQATRIFELEAKIKYLERQIEHKNAQLATTESKLEETEMWKRTFKGCYLALSMENENLTAINDALKRKNSNLEANNAQLKAAVRVLESTVKAFKVMIINIKRKEM